MALRLGLKVAVVGALGSSVGANPTESVSSTTELPKVSHQPVSQRTDFDGMASIGFEVADASLQPPQAIAILSPGNQVEDKFGDFIRVTTIPNTTISITQDDGTDIKYDLGNNKVVQNGVEPEDANILMYKKSDTEYILQVDGKLIHITNANNTLEDGYINTNSFKIYDSQTDIDSFIAFAERNGIDEHTVLGAKIVLKTLMSTRGYYINKLDESFMGPQADYLDFSNQTLLPVIEARLTATMSKLKQELEALKQCVQEGRENCRPTTSAPNSSATTTQSLEVSGAISPCLSVAASAVATTLVLQKV